MLTSPGLGASVCGIAVADVCSLLPAIGALPADSAGGSAALVTRLTHCAKACASPIVRFCARVPAPETAVEPPLRLAATAIAVARPLATIDAPLCVSIEIAPSFEVIWAGALAPLPRMSALALLCTSLRVRLRPTDTDLLSDVVLAAIAIALAATSD